MTTLASSPELMQLISSWQAGRDIGRHLTAMEYIPARQGNYTEFPEALDERLIAMLRARGFNSLYSHQTQAVDLALSGKNTVIVTPTASGKSLCYNLPVLQSLYAQESALFLFPTKALSQDQSAELNTLIRLAPDSDASWEAQVYDGDTPPDVRRRVRQKGRLVLTNPDMLHGGILPHHDKWTTFFRALRYVVIDELHTYRGVFGSHVANVLRRLRRICAHYGSNPTFIATSATIANPDGLAEALTGLPFSLVGENGAPAAERYLCFFNPPIVDAERMRRQGSLTAALRVARNVLKRGCGTIVFARSRQSVEVLVHRLKDRLSRDRDHKALADRIASYRGGYLPDLRRSIERGLREGHVKCVITTNALELGIDIGSLDVCILAGYPGTIASTWQQIGRAGRSGGTSLAVLIATDDPVDQYIINHPNYFMGQSPEEARIDPANLLIAVEHLKCACYELEWQDGEAFGDLDAEETTDALEFLAGETGMLHRVGSTWKWNDQSYPASEINLRSIAEENFVVIDISNKKPNVIAEVDFESAHLTLYPNAVYQVSGEPYRVERLDYDERRAYIRRSNDGYYTTAMNYRAVRLLDVFKERPAPRTKIGFGEVCVTQRFVGYKKIKFGTGENVGYGEINLPELDLHTMAYWLELAPRDFDDLECEVERPDEHRLDEHWARLVHGLGQALLTAASLRLMCDPRDLGLSIGSPTKDEWLTESFEGLTIRDKEGTVHGFGTEPLPVTEHHPTEAVRISKALFSPHIFLYDRYPGGVGFGEGLFEHHESFITLGLELVEACPCPKGCPSCVGPPDPDRLPVKADVARLLQVLER
ncbi:MAG: DEAD/DEAH box helicase [Bradymonadaceae bacterium]